jgi:hypothetical protein
MQPNTRAIFLGNEWINHYQVKEDDMKTLGGKEAVYKLMALYEDKFSPTFLMQMPPYTMISLIALNELLILDKVSTEAMRGIPPHEFAMELLMATFACDTAKALCSSAATRMAERNNPEMCAEAQSIAAALSNRTMH